MLPIGLAAVVLLHGQAGSALAGALERAMLGKSTVVELSRPLHETALESGASAGSDAAPITRLYAPLGAPAGRRTVAQIPARELLLQAVVIDIRTRVAADAGYGVGVKDLRTWERTHGRIPRRSMVLLRTGLDSIGGNEGRPAHLPGFQPEALAFLLEQREIRGVGQDARLPEPAAGGVGASPAGRDGPVQVENLTNLDRLPPKGAKLVVAPLRMTGESAPARVFAILP